MNCPPDIGRNMGKALVMSILVGGTEDHPQILQYVCVSISGVVQLGQDLVFFMLGQGESVKIGYTVHVLS